MQVPRMSVIIGTYNYLFSLQRCIASLDRQTFRDFEIIVADDGSTQDLVDWVQSYKEQSDFPVTHLWQEDNGFRKCRLLNKAVKISNTDYLVFIDADMILSNDYMRVHWENRQQGRYLAGRRSMISQELAEQITIEMIDKGYFNHVSWFGLWNSMRGKIKYYEEAMEFLDSIRGETQFSLLGSNFSMFKKDLLLVNGFDEDYETRGGGEDTDLAYRLKYVDVLMKSVRYKAIAHHLGHPGSESKKMSESLFLEKYEKISCAEDAMNINSILAGESADE